jgi:sulfide:quinone oxidoreductase
LREKQQAAATRLGVALLPVSGTRFYRWKTVDRRSSYPGSGRLGRVKKHVLILGAGFGGLELATRLSETMSDAVRVTLLDRNDSWYFGYSKLDVMLGRQSADDVRLYYSDVAKDGVEFRRETVTGIDPLARRVSTDVSSHDADYLVVAMGADYDMGATPGLQEGGHEYYTLAGAERLRDALQDFDGGKVLVSVLGQPFKCPPAPFEGAFMLHEHFKQRNHDASALCRINAGGAQAVGDVDNERP